MCCGIFFLDGEVVFIHFKKKVEKLVLALSFRFPQVLTLIIPKGGYRVNIMSLHYLTAKIRVHILIMFFLLT